MRTCKSTNSEDSKVGPGDYELNFFNTSFNGEANQSPINLKVPFNSTAQRKSEEFFKIVDTPGPGAYNLSKTIPNPDDLDGSFEKKIEEKKLPPNFYKAVEKNVIPEFIRNSLEESQKVYFNSKEKRFSLKREEIEKLSSPGPDAYTLPDVLNQKLEKNKPKGKIKFQEFMSTLSPHRISTIPSKDVYGYDYHGNVPSIIKDPELSFKTSGVKGDSVGPGQYDISPKWDKNSVVFDRMTQRNPNLFGIIINSDSQSQINNTSINNLTTSTALNSSCNSLKGKKGTSMSFKNTKNKTMFSTVFEKQKEQRTQEFEKVKMRLNQKNDEFFLGDPGPGYYIQDDLFTKNLKKYTSPYSTLGGTGPRFVLYKNAETEPTGKLVSSVDTKGKVYKLPGKIKNERLCKPVVFKRTPDYHTKLGPGAYELSKKFIKESLTNTEEFGARDMRFRQPRYSNTDNPGPGDYENNPNGIKAPTKEDGEDNKEITEYRNVKYEVTPFEVPPVGTYNPGLISTIGYKVHHNINEFQDNKKVGFSSQDKRFKKKKGLKPLPGPGEYYKEKLMKSTQRKVPFNGAKEREGFGIPKFPTPGPGTYELTSYNDWNIKSHNILFV